MKKSLLIVIYLALTATLWSQTIFLPQKPRNSVNHKASFDPNIVLSLASEGLWNAVITVPEDATPTAKYAAKELKTYLDRIIGSPIALGSALVPGKINLVVGLNSISKTFPITIPALPRDAFVIQHTGTKETPCILIAGNDDPAKDPGKLVSQKTVWVQFYQKATLFAVYDFLERFTGTGFYFPDEGGIAVPNAKNLSVPAMTLYEAPDSTIRRSSYLFSSFVSPGGKVTLPGGGDQMSDKGWIWANRERDFYRQETEFVPNAHGLARMGLVERFGKTNPEFFSLLPNGQRDISLEENHGHLCLLNQGLEDVVFADCLSYLKGEPPTVRNMVSERFKTALWNLGVFQPGYVNIMPQDGFGDRTRCRCTDCTAFFNTNGSTSEYVFGFVSRVAHRLKATGVPGTVTTMAYSSYLAVPKVNFPDNILMQVAPMGPWIEKYPDLQARDEALIHEWNKKLGKPRSVYLWNYINDYGGQIPHGVPAFSPRKIASYYKRLLPHITGAFLESEISYRFYNYLNWSLYFKMLWDSETDVEVYLKNHHAALFGAGAAPMGKFYDALESAWDACIGDYKGSDLGPTISAKNDSEIWNTVFTAARLAEWKKLFDEAESLAKNQPSSLKHIAYMREHLLGAMEKYRAVYVGGKRELEDLTWPSFRIPKNSSVDGDPGKPFWQNAEASTLLPFKSDGPVRGLTLVRTAWSEDKLHVLFECHESRMNDLLALDRKRDDPNIWQDASVEVFVSFTGDRSRYGHIIVNSAGSISDELMENGEHNWKWDSGAEVVVKKSSDRFFVEMAIPLPAPGKKNLVANFTRSRILKDGGKENQLQSLSPFLQKGFHDTERYGSLMLLESRDLYLDDNILTNGSFENVSRDGVAKDWNMVARVAFVDSGSFRHGQKCAKIQSEDFPSSAAKMYQYIPPLKPDTEYTITYYVKVENLEIKTNEAFAGGFMNVFGAPGNRFFPVQKYQGNLPWTKESFTFKTGPKPSEVNYVNFGFNNAKGTMWFDDVRLREKKPGN